MTSVVVGDTAVRIYADRRNGPLEVRLEFSAPSVLDGHNGEPLDLTYLPDMADAAVTAIGREISGMPPYELLRPARIDVARDFPSVALPP